MNFADLVHLVNQWADEKGIHEKGNCFTQLIKTNEEVSELLVAINNSDTEEIKDAIGDILVTLINASWFITGYDIIATCYKIKYVDKVYRDVQPVDFHKNISNIFNSLGELFSNLLNTTPNKKGYSKEFVKMYIEQMNIITDALDNIVKSDIISDVTLESCLEIAYNVISKRTGKIVNGTFVKDK